MKHLQRKSLYRYAAALFAFLCFLGICLAAFFMGIQRAVERNTQEMLADNVARQSGLVVSLMEIEFDALNGLAAFIGEQGSAQNPETLRGLMNAVVSQSKFHRITWYTADGIGLSSTGEAMPSGNGQNFFEKSIRGESVVSEPFESVVDGENLIALSVPVYQGDAITGVLVGSYDVRYINEIPFSDLYDGSGYVYIMDLGGKVIAMDSRYSAQWNDVNFYDYYSRFTFDGGDSLAGVQEDFEQGRGGVCLLHSGSDARYLVYEPIGYNHWVLCYVVPQKNAQQSYAFIQEYEVALSLFVVAGLIILLAVLQYINARDRRQLVDRAETDAMTGLLNAVSTRETIDAWLRHEGCRGVQALIMLDIDKFKDVNDTYGHAVGDEALRQTAGLLKRHFRGTDIVGRVGGDEFIIFMKNIPDARIVEKQLTRLCAAFHTLRVTDTPELRLTCSAGAAMSTQCSGDFDTLYKQADQAMYTVKRGTRDGFSIYYEA